MDSLSSLDVNRRHIQQTDGSIPEGPRKQGRGSDQGSACVPQLSKVPSKKTQTPVLEYPSSNILGFLEFISQLKTFHKRDLLSTKQPTWSQSFLRSPGSKSSFHVEGSQSLSSHYITDYPSLPKSPPRNLWLLIPGLFHQLILSMGHLWKQTNKQTVKQTAWSTSLTQPKAPN